MANILRTICTKFCENRPGFVDHVTKTFWCVFSVHSIEQDDNGINLEPKAVSDDVVFVPRVSVKHR